MSSIFRVERGQCGEIREMSWTLSEWSNWNTSGLYAQTNITKNTATEKNEKISR